MNIEQAEQLASHILKALDESFCLKLRELKPEIEKLRAHFKNLGKSEQIAGCKTWKEFCRVKLHRTDRAVRLLLASNRAEVSSVGKRVKPEVHTLESHRKERYVILRNQVKAYFRPLRQDPDFKAKVAEFFRSIADDLGVIVEVREQ